MTVITMVTSVWNSQARYVALFGKLFASRIQISLLLSILLFICAKMINLLRETREVCQSSLLSIYSQKHVSYKLLIHLNNDLVFVFSQLLSLLFEDLFKRFNAEVNDKVYFVY